MANDESSTDTTILPAETKQQNTTDRLSTGCSVCPQQFKTFQECLKHELLEHSLPKKTSLKTGVESRLKSTRKFLNSKDKREERAKIHNALENCPKGQELTTILRLLTLNTESLGLIITRIQTCLEKELRTLGPVRIYPFGSIASGLALRDSDIDIFLDASQIITREFHSPKHRQSMPEAKRQLSQQRGSFNRINALLQRSPLFVDVFPIRATRVPIIKCKHRDTGFSIDINNSFPSSMENTKFLRDLVKTDRRIHEMFVFLKLWAKNMQIIGRANMTSYCLITIMIFYLQNGNSQKYMKPVQELQKNCRPHLVQGINYAFDLQTNDKKPNIPKRCSTFDLIKGFLNFYKGYNFEENIISPFYGRTIARKDFTEKKFKDYSTQLATITLFSEQTPDPIQLDRCMCVQDSFALNHNVARTMQPSNKKYFVMCLENAANICDNLNNSSIGEILEKLLYETISKPCSTKESINKDNDNVESSNGLSHFIAPSKSDLNSIVNHYVNLTDSDAILRFWCQHYVTVIKNILCDFYRIDMHAKSSTPLKQQRLENEDLSESWHISGSVDLWSNRYFQKSSKHTFWKYQLKQTERLHSQRRQEPKHAAQLNAIFTVSTQSDFTGISVSVSLPDGSETSSLNKKNPLRKFFNVFRNTLQNYSIKDTLSGDKLENDQS